MKPVNMGYSAFLLALTYALWCVNTVHANFTGEYIGCADPNDEHLTAVVECPKGYVISDLHADVHILTDDAKSSKCYGDTASLMNAVNNCYWQQKCELKFPHDTLITCQGRCLEFKCLWAKPNVMKVNRARCVKEDEVVSIVPLSEDCKKRDETNRRRRDALPKKRVKKDKNKKQKGNKKNNRRKKGKKKCEKGIPRRRKCSKEERKACVCRKMRTKNRSKKPTPTTPKTLVTTGGVDNGDQNLCSVDNVIVEKQMPTQVIIRSHSDFPWFYSSFEADSKHTLRFIQEKQSPKCVHVEVKQNHVCDGDQLIITVNGREEYGIPDSDTNAEDEETNIRFHRNVKNGNVSFALKIASESQGCGGFIICMRGTETCEATDEDAVCDIVQSQEASVTVLDNKGPPKTYGGPCCEDQEDLPDKPCYQCNLYYPNCGRT